MYNPFWIYSDDFITSMDFYIITYVYIFGFVFLRLSRRFLVMISMLFVKCSFKVPSEINEDNKQIGYILHLILFFCIRNLYFYKKYPLTLIQIYICDNEIILFFFLLGSKISIKEGILFILKVFQYLMKTYLKIVL